MRKAALAVLWIFLASASLPAQEVPKAEMYWGYSLLRIERLNLHGWNTSIAGMVNRNLGIVFDFSGHYGSDTEPFGATSVRSDFTAHTFLLGPRVSESVGRWTPYAHALFGVTRLTVDFDITQPGAPAISFADTDVGFALAAGGGLDYQISESVTLRLVQADYFLARPDGFKDEGARLGAGILFRLGRKSP